MSYAGFLGLTIELRDGDVIATLPYAPHLIGNPSLPALHGGCIGALLEHAALHQLLAGSTTVPRPTLVTFTIDYLRSGAPVDTHARAIVTRRGRRVANVRAEAWQRDRATAIATATGIFLIPTLETAEPPAAAS